MIGVLPIPALEQAVTLLGSAALVGGSVYLVARALRLRRDNVAARVSLIGPWTHTASIAAGILPEAADEWLLGTELSSDEREFARRLQKFGIPARYARASLLAFRIWCTVCFSVGWWFFAPHLLAVLAVPVLRILLAGCAGVFGWYLPAFAAQWAAKRRANAIVAGLPDALELLVICAEGGLALGDGIDRIVGELRRSQPQLADELALTAADLKILPSQDQALARLAARIDVPIMQSVVTTLLQTLRYGTPFAQAIRTMASEIRNDALIRLEERANRLPTLLTIPMILFILPIIFLVIGGPAALKMLDMFSR